MCSCVGIPYLVWYTCESFKIFVSLCRRIIRAIVYIGQVSDKAIDLAAL